MDRELGMISFNQFEEKLACRIDQQVGSRNRLTGLAAACAVLDVVVWL